MIALKPNEAFVKGVWEKVKNAQGPWAQLDGTSYEQFLAICMSSDLLIDLGFGVGRISDLAVGHSCRVHGVFWSKDAYTKIGEVAIALLNTAKGLRLRRIDCVVPSGVRSLRRYMHRLGFKFEGRMASYYRSESGFFDGDLYAVTFEEEVYG